MTTQAETAQAPRIVTFKMDAAEYERLAQIADKDQRSVSFVIRAFIRDGIDRENPKDEAA